MKKIFIINGGIEFAHSGGKFNNSITQWTKEFFEAHNDDFEIKITHVNALYNLQEEVDKYVWADTIIYHTPIWWFQIPNQLKKYIDEVFTVGHQNGLYKNDGRSSKNPNINYGTGGMLQGRTYMATTSWNAPETAFTLPGEFFNQTPVDDGILFGFHRMNAFIGLEKLDGFHFHDVMKSDISERIITLESEYKNHLQEIFSTVSQEK